MYKSISSNELYDNIQTLMGAENSSHIVDGKILKSYGNIHYKCFGTARGIAYCSLQSNFNQHVCIHDAETGGYSFLAFNTGHPVRLKTVNDKQEHFIAKNLFFDGMIQEGAHSCGFYEPNKSYQNHFIVLENHLFQTYCESFAQKEEHFCIYRKNLANAKQLLLLGEIATLGHLSPSLQPLYLEAKLLELLCTSFQDTPATQNRSSCTLSSQDIASLHKAKTLLLHNLQSPPSIKELARKAAINEFKLKKGFKQLFGTTIYGALHEHRLEEAKQLLLNNDINIQEAAALVGYSSLGHFSKIFKAKYGVLPLAVKHRKIP